MITEMFWNASLEEMKKGYVQEDNNYTCLLCGKQIEKGIIYPVGELLYEAEKYMVLHIEEAHGSVFEFLSAQDKKLTGLSEHQNSIMSLFYIGKSDNEVQKELNIGSSSTIRNHRFALKEKERQSRVFLVMMDHLKEKNKTVVQLVKPHPTAKMVDDRYNITQEEEDKILTKYFPEGVLGKLKTFTMQEKHKIVVLREMINRFDRGKLYTEKEVDGILETIHEKEYVVTRRYLIQYGFMDRKKDGSAYWVKGSLREEKLLQKKTMSGVYQIRNTKNQKIFINTGRNISKLNGAKFELNMGSHRNKALQNDWKEYGEEAFVFEVLESFEEGEDAAKVSKELNVLKEKWMQQIQPYGDKGYHVKK